MRQGSGKSVYSSSYLLSISTESLAFHLVLRFDRRLGNMSSVLMRTGLMFSEALNKCKHEEREIPFYTALAWSSDVA
jgi:hypothetical protein